MNTALTLGSFVFFTALVAAITWWKSRGGDSGSNDGFFLAGRSLTFPFIAASLLLTNLSTEQLVGLNGQGYTTGLAVMMWEVVGVFAIVLMALFFLPKFLKSGITTVPELLDMRFGPRAQLACNIIFMLAYSTEQILFRQDPWRDLIVDRIASGEEQVELKEADYAQLFEQWMVAEKPYCNPEFKLMDIRSVLPMNRTYLSQFINDTYGCSFYQFVNRYRIEEAKRLMQEHPEMKISEIAAHSGFSSSSSFSRVFSRETGLSPSEWSKKG